MMTVYVTTDEDGSRVLRGSYEIGEARAELFERVEPGEKFGGLTHEQLTDGTYFMNDDTFALTPTSN